MKDLQPEKGFPFVLFAVSIVVGIQMQRGSWTQAGTFYFDFIKEEKMKKMILYTILAGFVFGIVYQAGRQSAFESLPNDEAAISNSSPEVDRRLQQVSASLDRIEALRSGSAPVAVRVAHSGQNAAATRVVHAGQNTVSGQNTVPTFTQVAPVDQNAASIVTPTVERYHIRQLPLGVDSTVGISTVTSPGVFTRGLSEVDRNIGKASAMGLMPLLPVDSSSAPTLPVRVSPKQKCDCGIEH